MPITKSAKKALRASRNKQDRNNKARLGLEIALKKVSLKNLASVVSKIDKAAKNNIISKNKAARIKSSLSKNIGVKGVVKREASVSAVAKTKTAASKSTKKTVSKTTKKKV